MLKYCAVIFSLFLFGCTNKPKERRIELDEVVDYREILFGVQDSLLTIVPDLKKSSYDIGYKLLEALKVDSIENSVDFNLSINGNKYPVRMSSINRKYFEKYNCELCYNKVYLFSNFEWVNEGIIHKQTIDDFDFYLALNVCLKDSIHEYITLDWSIDKPGEENLNLNIVNLFEGAKLAYLLTYQRLSNKMFNKDLSMLSINELNQVKNKYSYKINIGVVKPVPPPLPPLKK